MVGEPIRFISALPGCDYLVVAGASTLQVIRPKEHKRRMQFHHRAVVGLGILEAPVGTSYATVDAVRMIFLAYMPGLDSLRLVLKAKALSDSTAVVGVCFFLHFLTALFFCERQGWTTTGAPRKRRLAVSSGLAFHTYYHANTPKHMPAADRQHGWEHLCCFL